MGPHRISVSQRPGWFFEKEKVGGILVDLGCHQIEQFLFYSGAKDARVLSSKVRTTNSNISRTGGFWRRDAPGGQRRDELFPGRLVHAGRSGVWGDGRAFILGTDGYIEMRKYIDVARCKDGDQVYLVDHKGERQFSVTGQVGFPFFGALILDSLNPRRRPIPRRCFSRLRNWPSLRSRPRHESSDIHGTFSPA